MSPVEFSGTPTDATEFNDALQELLYAAYESGVGVEGGWECRYDPDVPDWEIQVTEITKDWE